MAAFDTVVVETGIQDGGLLWLEARVVGLSVAAEVSDGDIVQFAREIYVECQQEGSLALRNSYF